MSLSSALFTSSQSQVLGWIFGHSEREFHFSELLRLTQLSSASLQRELNRLSESGIVNSKRLGNLRIFKANQKSPVYQELHSLVKKTLGIDHEISIALTPLHQYLEHALIYGSVAKNTDTASSDIDLMLVGKNLRLSKILDLLTPVESKIGRKINTTCYTSKEFESRRAERTSFVNKVLALPTIVVYGAAID
jgi:predicted nucleotidyltransferase